MRVRICGRKESICNPPLEKNLSLHILKPRAFLRLCYFNLVLVLTLNKTLLYVNFRGSTERIWGRVMGEECIVIYLDSRAPILVFSGFLCHLRQTKVKCFCLVNISVIWTAAFPHRGTGGFLQIPSSQIQLYKHVMA